ncbi:MAG: site-2 protease family protein [Candidatus Bathyarchaeia archaeon]|nr:site-2 protease family protein [Candidatus Bathyarchaeota archaeon]
MNEILIFTLTFLAFWLVVYMLGKSLPLQKYGLDIKPFLIKWESKRFRGLLYRLSSRWKRIWKIFSWASVFIGAGLMVFTLTFLSLNIIRAAVLRETLSPVRIIVPGLTLRLYWLPYFIVAVIVTVFIHEAAHGVIALNEGISIRSAGALLLGIFFGGFVETDEKELNAAPPKSKMKIFSAGSASNMLAGLIVLLVLSALFVQSPSGLIVLETLEGGPLQKAGIRPWDVIYALNDHEIHSLQDLVSFMSSVKPGEDIIVRTSRGDFIVKAAPSPDNEHRAIIGLISSAPYYPSKLGLSYLVDTYLNLTLNWLSIVLLSVAAFNMLPIPYLDGDKMLQCLIEVAPRKGPALRKTLNVVSLFLLLANIVMSSTY